MMMMIKEGGNGMGGCGGGRKQGGSSATAASPCAACKLLRRRCAQDCVFAPYFPADQPHKFATVHKVFGASNVNKMLQELPEQQRGDAVSSMVYEANARVRDPVYGCVGTISALQQQIDMLQKQLALAQAEVLCLQMRQHTTDPVPKITTNSESPENGSSSSSKFLPYTMDMVADHQAAAAGDSLCSLMVVDHQDAGW